MTGYLAGPQKFAIEMQKRGLAGSSLGFLDELQALMGDKSHLCTMKDGTPGYMPQVPTIYGNTCKAMDDSKADPVTPMYGEMPVYHTPTSAEEIQLQIAVNKKANELAVQRVQALKDAMASRSSVVTPERSQAAYDKCVASSVDSGVDYIVSPCLVYKPLEPQVPIIPAGRSSSGILVGLALLAITTIGVIVWRQK